MAIINPGTLQERNIKHAILPYIEAYYKEGLLSSLMGGKDSVIWTKNIARGAGESVVFNTSQTYSYPVNRGNNFGNALITTPPHIFIGTDDVKVESFRFAEILDGDGMVEQATGLDLWNLVKIQLRNRSRDLKDTRLLNALASAFMGGGGAAGTLGDDTTVPNTKVQIKAIMDAGSFNVDTNAKLSEDRFMFGQGGTAIGNTVALKSATICNADNVLDCDMLYKLSVLADEGSHSTSIHDQNPIKPVKTSGSGHSEDRNYILLCSEKSFESLLADEKWVAQTQRGTIEDKDLQPSILHGRSYKGTMYGIHVITDRLLSGVNIGAANAGYHCGYSVLLGQGALGHVIAKTPDIIEDDYDFKYKRGFCHHEISGLKVLKFPARRGDDGRRGLNAPPFLENGLIHVISAHAV